MPNDKREKNWLAMAALALMVPVVGQALVMWRGQALIHRELQALSEDIEEVSEHDATVSKFWRLHGWERDQITLLRVAANLGVEPWPDLNE
jgi:hypothetical protein